MRSVSEQTLKDYTLSVYSVKSTSESIGDEAARKMAAELEALAKNGNLSGVLAKNGALLDYLDKLLINIKAWLERQD